MSQFKASLLLTADATNFVAGTKQARQEIDNLTTSTDKQGRSSRGLTDAKLDEVRAQAAAIRAATAQAVAQNQSAAATALAAKNTLSAGQAFGSMAAGARTALAVVVPFGAMFAAAGAAALAMGASVVIGAFKAASALEQQAEKVAASVEGLQELRLAGTRFGTDFRTVDAAMAAVSKRAEDVVSGNAAAVRSFKAVGVSVTDGQGRYRDMAEVMADVVVGLGKVPNASARATLANDLLGDGAQRLSGMIGVSADALADARAEAVATGLVLSGDTVAAAAAAERQLAGFADVLGQQVMIAGANAIPMIADVAQQLLNATPAIISNVQAVLEWLGILERTPLSIARANVDAQQKVVNEMRAQLPAQARLRAMLAPFERSSDFDETSATQSRALDQAELQLSNSQSELARLETENRERWSARGSSSGGGFVPRVAVGPEARPARAARQPRAATARDTPERSATPPNTDLTDLIEASRVQVQMNALSEREQAILERTLEIREAAREQGRAMTAEEAEAMARQQIGAERRAKFETEFTAAVREGAAAAQTEAVVATQTAATREQAARAAELYAIAVADAADWTEVEAQGWQARANEAAASEARTRRQAEGARDYNDALSERAEALARESQLATLTGRERMVAARAEELVNLRIKERADWTAAEIEAIRTQAQLAAENEQAQADAAAFVVARGEAFSRLTEMASEELELAGLTRQEREVTALVEAEIARLKENGIELSAEQLAAYRAELKARAEAIVAQREINDLADDLASRVDRAADDVTDAWTNAWDRMLDGSLDGFEDFGKAIVNLWKAQILRQIMQPVTVPVTFANQGGSAGVGGAGGGLGGIFDLIGNLFNLGGGGGGSGSKTAAGTINKAGQTFADTINNSARRTGDIFERIATQFGAKAGGSLAKLANAGGQAFFGGRMGVEVAKSLGLKGSDKQSWQAVGDVVAGSVGMALGGPIGAGIATLLSRAIGTLTRDKDYPYARSDIVVKDGRFQVTNTDALDGGPSAEVAAASGDIAKALNDAATLLGLDMRAAAGTYTSFGYTTGRHNLAGGYFGGAVKTSSDWYDQTSDVLGTGHKGRSNLDSVGTIYGHAVAGNSDPAVAALEVVKDTIVRMAERSGDAFSAAEIAVIRAASSIEDAWSRIEKGRSFTDSVETLILEITEPATAARKKALKAVDDQIAALKAEANELIGQGLVGADVLVQIDRLKDLRVAQTLEELGDAASTAVSALRAAAPRLQEWLDRVRLSDASQLSPRDARALAMAQYERALEKAKAGDVDALSAITGYADALIAADQAATDDAQARLALFTSVTGAIEKLVGAGKSPTETLLADLITVTDTGLRAVTDAVMKIADLPAQPWEEELPRVLDRLGNHIIEIPEAIDFRTTQTLRFEERLLDELAAQSDEVRETWQTIKETLGENGGMVSEAVTRAAERQTEALTRRLEDLSAAFEDQARQQNITNGYIRQIGAL